MLHSHEEESLSGAFHIAVRVREIKNGAGYRVFQMRKTGNRHLVDIRSVDSLPKSRKLDGVRVLSPADLIAGKVVSYQARLGKPKAGTDWRDLALLLLTLPKLKCDPGPVTNKVRPPHSNQLRALKR